MSGKTLRHFLTLPDVSAEELLGLLKTATRMKRDRRIGSQALAQQTVALVFQKPSMRTRVAFEVAVLQLGGSVVYLGQEDIQLGQREPIKDVARVLSRYVNAIVARTFAHHDAEEFAKYATVPVINGLSDLVHPCQALADLFTMEEACGRLKGLKLAYVGDGNNVLHSLIQGGALFGMHMTVATPEGYRPDPSIWQTVARQAKATGGSLAWEPEPARAVQGADVLYTDVWVSMGDEEERDERIKAFQVYQIDCDLIKKANANCRIMHCLPAHRGEEIADEVIEGESSLIFDQAENRLHVQKALLLMLLGKGKDK